MQRRRAQRREPSFRWESGFRLASDTTAGAVIPDTTVTDIQDIIPTDIIGRIGRIGRTTEQGTVTTGLTIGTMAVRFITAVGLSVGKKQTSRKNFELMAPRDQLNFFSLGFGRFKETFELPNTCRMPHLA